MITGLVQCNGNREGLHNWTNVTVHGFKTRCSLGSGNWAALECNRTVRAMEKLRKTMPYCDLKSTLPPISAHFNILMVRGLQILSFSSVVQSVGLEIIHIISSYLAGIIIWNTRTLSQHVLILWHSVNLLSYCTLYNTFRYRGDYR